MAMMNRRIAIMAVAATLATASLGLSHIASAADWYTPGGGNLAIGGYDPVAYFKVNRPEKGKGAFSTNYKGARWLFANQENLDAFKANPARYAPQFGGYCAYAAAKGYKASTVPEAFSVVGGKLYLNYSLPVRDLWDANQSAFIKQGNANWPKLAR